MKKRSIKITHAIYPIYAVCHLFDDYLWREMRNHMNGSTRMNNAATIVLVPFGFSPNGEMKEYDNIQFISCRL